MAKADQYRLKIARGIIVLRGQNHQFLGVSNEAFSGPSTNLIAGSEKPCMPTPGFGTSSEMLFHVGAHRYSLAIPFEPIVVNGSPMHGLCRELDRKILISPSCPPAARLAVLLHELAHAWVFATDQPSGLEGWCDLTATIAASALRDLAVCGGEAALVRMLPGESPQPAAARIGISGNRTCAACQETRASGSVICTAEGSRVCVRLYCPFCNHVQRWIETLAADGLASGVVVGEPTHDRGEAVRDFLRAWPAAG